MLHFCSRGDLVNVESRDTNGNLLGAASSRFASNKSFAEVAGDLGLDKDAFRLAVDAFRVKGVATADVPPPGVSTPKPFSVLLRGMHEKDAEAVPCASLQAAIEYAEGKDLIVKWADGDVLCCVDADLHYGDYKLTELQVTQIADAVKPRPRAYWRTKNGGLRLVYEAQAGFTARELAGVACLGVARLEPLATLELKTETRVPPGPYTFQTQTADTSELASWLGIKESDDDEVAEYLAERGLEVGRRYPHDKCPVGGDDTASREPVRVTESGIYCHACHNRGVCRGSSKPGWFPFAALCGSLLPTPLRACIRNRVHWEHARFLLSELLPGIKGDVARACYGAALCCSGLDRRLVDAALQHGGNFVRFEGYWGTLLGESFKDYGINAILGTLPICQYIDGGKVHVSAERVARLAQNTDLSPLGYFPLRRVWGCRIYGQRLVEQRFSSVPIVLQTGPLTVPGTEDRRPRYIPASKRRMTEDAAWAVLERPFPGLNRVVVKLFIAARGCQEGRIGLPPMVFIHGPTAAAKTSIVMIAAAICGDATHTVIHTSDTDRLRQGILTAKEKGSFAIFNEYLKGARRRKEPPVSAMDFALNITADSTSWKAFHGPIPMGTPPVCVWTDSHLPEEILKDGQIGRRIVNVPMLSKVFWEQTILDSGVIQVADLRVAGKEYADAANVILSSVIDDYFSEPLTFTEIAAKLGYFPLNKSPEAEEGGDALKHLFEVACRSPRPSDSDARRWPGRGWKTCTPEERSDLAEAWKAVADEDLKTSRRCSEVDWAEVLGVAGPISFELRHNGRRVAFRWVRRQNRVDYQATEELQQTDNADLTWNLSLPEGV